MGLSRWFSREHSGPGRQLYNELARILCISLDRTVACATRYGTYWTTLWVVGNSLLASGVSDDIIINCTGISLADFEKIKAETEKI